jgi:hypothetical protein
MPRFFNNCRARDHAGIYGGNAFYDLNRTGKQAEMANNLKHECSRKGALLCLLQRQRPLQEAIRHQAEMLINLLASANYRGRLAMEPRLAMTVTGTGSDGREYTIHGYKRMLPRGDEWVEEALISIMRTEEGEEVHCKSENPLTFWMPRTGVKIRCRQPE